MSREHGQGENLEVVFQAHDEFTADLLYGLLTGENIPAIIQSHMVPWTDGIFMAGERHWGDIVVPREYVKRSLEIISDYMSNNHTDGEKTAE